MMHHVTLLIGGNQGDRHQYINHTTELVRQRIGSVIALSGIYETEPWGNFDIQNSEIGILNFLNCALLVETEMTPEQVLHEALAIEASQGRVRTEDAPVVDAGERVYHSRPMDIDIIFYDNLVRDTPDLQIPHPRMHLRRFVLEPLAEIMPQYRHPILDKTVEELLHEIIQKETLASL